MNKGIIVLFCVALMSFSAPSEASQCDMVPLGVNLSGGEFGGVYPGVRGRDYSYPSLEDYKSFKDSGVKIVRVPFRWERIQPILGMPLDSQALTDLDNIVDTANKYGMSVILDMHNSAMFKDFSMSNNALLINSYLETWGSLARHYAGRGNVLLGLMNEPIKIGADEWFSITQKTIGKIRGSGFKGALLVSGVIYTGVHSWLKKIDGVSNADAFSGLADPLGNTFVEMHQYFDVDYSGTHDQCKSDFDAVKIFTGATTWLREHHLKGFLGEFGAAANTDCLSDLDKTLAYLNDNKDVWGGATFWSAGSRWGASYPYLIDQKRGKGLDILAHLMGYMCK